MPASQRHPLVNKQGFILAPVRWPILTFYPAPRSINTRCAVIICPGGAYSFEVVRREGIRPAQRFNKFGVNCFVLRYRLPDGKLPPSGVPWPLQDIRRAIQIVRFHASQWKINPHRVGVMGFSAGGSVASLAGVHWLPGNPDAKNPLNRFSTRPDFMVLCYPVISMMPSITHPGSHNAFLGARPPLDVEQYFSSELNVTSLTPPAFICYAHDDTVVNHQNEKRFYAALKRNGVPAKLVEFKRGQHGFGIGAPGTGSVKWPIECERWLVGLGLLPVNPTQQGKPPPSGP